MNSTLQTIKGRGFALRKCHSVLTPLMLTYLAGDYTLESIKLAVGLIGWGALLTVVVAVIAIVLGKGTQRVVYDVPEGELSKGELA